MASAHLPYRDVLHVAAGIFGSSAGMTVTRIPEGHSTLVYRVRRGEATWYLRVLPEEEDSFAPEARVHAILHVRGVRVPDVIYWEHRHPLLQCSVMVTTEIPGHPIAPDVTPDALRVILAEAGRDLARINRVSVGGSAGSGETGRRS
jgi:hypothetical protein